MDFDINIIKTDNSLDYQKELLKEADKIIDLTDYKGLRLCSWSKILEKILDEISNKLRKLSLGVCFLGSGDFHHLSFSLISNISVKPILLLIDYHADMYETFPDMISCGSWAMQALKEEKVKKCIVVGVDAKDPAINKFKFQDEYVTFFPINIPKKLMIPQVLDELSKSQDPIYISIDKDVLCKEDAATGWEQGLMHLDELLELLLHIKKTGKVIGVDVCGEWVLPIDEIMFSIEDRYNIQLNQRANVKILERMLH